MHPRIGRSIIDKYRPVIIGNPAVGEKYVAYIAYTLFVFGSHEVTAGSGYQSGRVIQGRHVHI